MVSLWGNKDNTSDSRPPDGGDVEGHASEPGESHTYPRLDDHRDPDERTRLLPPRRDGFLDPDDPAVSPYNLWSVRALRQLSVLFLVISFIWWVFLLVSIFISPPGMHSRGSGFFDFSFTTLTVGNLLVALLFFSTPSKMEQVFCLVLSVLLLVDMILILSVPRLRIEEGWVGIASVIWAVFIAIWAVVTDRTVSWGKREEEQRLTGREVTRRTLKQWCAVFTTTIVLGVYIAVVVLLTATLILRASDASLSPPGKRYFVDSDKYQVHLFCSGNLTDPHGNAHTTVLFEGGEGPVENGLTTFADNALINGTIHRYCYWDRPGIAWSDNAPSPLSAGMAADALSEALARAGEEGPWIVASAGVGGIYSRIFASRHATDIKGIFLIDTLHEDLLHRIGSPTRGFLLWAWGVISPLGLDRLAGAIFKGRTREDRVFGRSAYQGGKYIKAKLQENLMADSLSKHEIASARMIQSPSTPLVVISSGMECKRDSEWEGKQRDLTHLTDNLLNWDIVNGAPHEVWTKSEGREIMEKRLGELVRKDS
ncbi:MAG: hypothetical protein M1829_006521 [Trizodia sp. TS-e1964]|nr:MAG: hypothetical protein M1829_006521 [Trizodia sp. TS-e1964]